MLFRLCHVLFAQPLVIITPFMTMMTDLRFLRESRAKKHQSSTTTLVSLILSCYVSSLTVILYICTERTSAEIDANRLRR